MKLYLVRHGEAAPAINDDQRPLSQNGQRQVQKMGDFLAKTELSPLQIYHSGVLRAQQTATILAEALTPRKSVQYKAHLLPEDDLQPLLAEMHNANEDTMLVGHLPFLGNLTAALLADSTHFYPVSFKPGTIVCLEKHRGAWSIDWVLCPDLLANLCN